VFSYLAVINTILATFNLLPAFPLDGGRVFRAAIWGWTGNLQRATKLAAGTGRILGTFMMVLGVFSIISGNFVAGMWQALIGLFIIGAARSSEVQMVMKTYLDDVPVRQLMVGNPVIIPAHMPIDEIIEDYFYRFGHKVFPVVRGEVLLGWVRLEDIGKLAVKERARLTAFDVLSRDALDRTVSPDSSVTHAMDIMRKHNTSRLLVTSNGKLKGILTLKDIMNHVAVRQEIGAAGYPERSAEDSFG